MTRRFGVLAVAVGLGVGLVGWAAPGGADDGSPPSALVATIATLTGGGPGSGSSWLIQNDHSGACGLSGTGGLTVNDATLDPSGLDQRDAYDGAFNGGVDGTVFPASPNTTDGSTFVEGGPATMSGVQVTVRYSVIPGSTAVLREVVTFTNSGASTANITWNQTYNLGSDDKTTLVATGSGDTTLSADDSYSVSWDNDDDGDPVNTLVEFGNGPVLHPTFAGTCANTFSGDDSLRLDYPVSVPAGGTVRLMFFGVLDNHIGSPVVTAATNDVHASSTTTAIAAAPGYPAITTSSPLLAGLSAQELATIKNWNFPIAVAVVQTPKLTG